MSWLRLSSVASLIISGFFLSACNKSSPSTKAPTGSEKTNSLPPIERLPLETPEQKAERLKWFQEARFGMFIHWGVYSVPAGEYHGKPVEGYGEWIMHHASIPVSEYKAFAKDFTASDYDPKAWAALAKEAGMKYVVITSKHHDGFALYDSAASDWNAVKASGAKRDLIGPLAEAVRAAGLRFGLYYSQAQDWINPGGGYWKYKNSKNNEPWDPAQKGDFDEYLAKTALPQTKEILLQYHPDVIWWDTPANMTRERSQKFVDLLSLAPKIISNNRLGLQDCFLGDTKTPERRIPPRGYPGQVFEVCMTMNDTWGYKKNDDHWVSVRQILRYLSDISSKGGNFLLNVGPDSKGRIPQPCVERLQAVGRWMKQNGEAIYATKGGPFPRRLSWGRVTQKPRADGGVTMYAQVWDWPSDGEIAMPGLNQLPTSGKILVSGLPITAHVTSEGISVKLPGSAPDPDVSVVKLEFTKPLEVTGEPCPIPGPDGRITLTAYDADTHGSYTGNITLAGSGAEARLTGWTNEDWKMEYLVKSPTAQRWILTAEIASVKPSQFILQIKDQQIEVKTPATGAITNWQTVELARFSLPVGESRLEFLPKKEGWQGGPDIRKVWLSPAP
ncbi:MAG: alpha-L-fucosidase [Verrucomicrobia bacterium]|nr:alpha-L-fucosidase [Verrucomicrobiota bacterium]